LSRIHLVRHGDVHNPQRVLYGRLPGFSLSDAGRAQAAQAAEYLRSRRFAGALVVTSPLERARETAEIVHQGLLAEARGPIELRVDERLIEAGSWREGLPYAFDAAAAAAFLERIGDRSARPKDEPPRAIALRMRAAVLGAIDATEDDNEVILVSHQSPIRLGLVALEHEMGTPGERWRTRVFPWALARGACDYASVTTLAFEGSRLKPIRYWAPR
jgi:broad specificity phosphatase PhoE